MICPAYGYFGEYISGVFQFGASGQRAIVAAWGDPARAAPSRASTTQHHHVWAGAMRARRRTMRPHPVLAASSAHRRGSLACPARQSKPPPEVGRGQHLDVPARLPAAASASPRSA